MNQILTHQRSFWRGNPWFAALLLLATLSLRLVVPAGYMVEAGQNGRFLEIALCHSGTFSQESSASASLFLDKETGQLIAADQLPDQKHQAANDKLCDFAVNNIALSAPFAPLFSGPILAQTDNAPQFSGHLIIGQGLAAPPPWATGPPSHTL